MEKRIKEYEKFIKEAAKHPTPELREYHHEMMESFQHERLIHLFVTFFFGLLMLGALTALGVSFGMYGLTVKMIPLYILSTLLVILEIFYVKHYYFLENHTQALYDITAELYKVKK